MRRISLICMVLTASLGGGFAAFGNRTDEVWSVPQEKPAPAKIKALLITGGGYHDWKKINPVMHKKLPQLAHVTIDEKSGLETLKDPKFADAYDIVIYNFCYADEKDNKLIENALKVTRDGKPTMMIHCAMHTFQASDDWTAKRGPNSPL